MKRLTLALLCAALCALLCGCTVMSDPLSVVEATPVPGLDMRLHAATAADSNTSSVQATLYFRYRSQPMLASETRTLHVKRDESAELAVVRALLEGPSAGYVELNRLFPDTVKVERVSSRGDLLFVTFSRELLSDDAIPADPEAHAQWLEEAPTRRALMLQSVVASITETFPYSSVQFLVSTDTHSGTRLDLAYLLAGGSGPSDPFVRDEALLLTPHNTALQILEAWRARDFESLYGYTASQSSAGPLPVYAAFAAELDDAAFLTDYAVSPGSVSADGTSAVLTASLTLRAGADTLVQEGLPLRLTRENGLWKIDYPTLLTLTLAGEADERS